MVKTFDGTDLSGITAKSLNLLPGDLSGDLISGGKITNFSSTGIQDNATIATLVVTDGNISVSSITVPNITGNTTVRGDLKIYGVLDAGFVRTTELITNQRYEKQYIEFAQDNEQGTNVGTGLLWPGDPYNKQLVYRNNPDRFYMTESVDIASDKSFLIGGLLALNSHALGNGIVDSSLQTLGNLKSLNVNGDINFADCVFFDSRAGKFSVGNLAPVAKFSVYDSVNDIEVIIDGNSFGRAVVGTFNTKPLDIVTDDQTRISIETNGNITLGQENRDATVIRAYGKLGVGVKNPREQFEVAGNIRFANKLFVVGDEPPTSGSFALGDIVWNSQPRPTGWSGWICVAPGSPGLWKPFGQISA
jgi:hypothetical protein